MSIARGRTIQTFILVMSCCCLSVSTVGSSKPTPGGEECCVGCVTVQYWRHGRHLRARNRLALFDGAVEEHLPGPIRVEGALYIVATP